jgi:hypothetical protein
MLTGRWLGTHGLETVAAKNGQIVGRGMYEVSADGRTLTVSATGPGANADGWQTDCAQVIVFDRV